MTQIPVMQVCFAVLVGLVAVAVALPAQFDQDYQWVNPVQFEGDVFLTKNNEGSHDFNDKNYIWPSGVIHYQFHPTYEGSNSVAKQHIHRCLHTFPQYTRENYVVIGAWQQDSCFSASSVFTGGQPQNLGILFGCHDYESMAPELLDAFGFWHLQPKTKPDEKIKITWDNKNTEGRVEVTQGNKNQNSIAPAEVIGDHEIIDNCKRIAKMRGDSGSCQLWAVTRQCFYTIMMRTAMIRKAEYIKFLMSVPVFKSLPIGQLEKLADAVEMVTYENGDYILHQGDRGEKFFVISKGHANVTFELPETHKEKFIRTLKERDFFGEKAFQGDHLRTANIIANDPEGVTCLMIDSDTYNQIISGLDEIKMVRYI